jgi:hypothetical protein
MALVPDRGQIAGQEEKGKRKRKEEKEVIFKF